MSPTRAAIRAATGTDSAGAIRPQIRHCGAGWNLAEAKACADQFISVFRKNMISPLSVYGNITANRGDDMASSPNTDTPPVDLCFLVEKHGRIYLAAAIAEYDPANGDGELERMFHHGRRAAPLAAVEVDAAGRPPSKPRPGGPPKPGKGPKPRPKPPSPPKPPKPTSPPPPPPPPPSPPGVGTEPPGVGTNFVEPRPPGVGTDE